MCMQFFSEEWCGVSWTAWIPFSVGSFILLPRTPGVYRVRATDSDELFYIGQTGRNLRERLSQLRHHTLANPFEMPYNDPHTAAPSLWAWRKEEGFEFECSAASLPSLGN